MTVDSEIVHYAKALTRIRHKKFEFYAISRILHRLDDPQIEFRTQQPVRRADGATSLIDLFFPQFRLAVEIDEPSAYHGAPADLHRQRAIEEVAGVTFERIVLKDAATLAELNRRIDAVVARIVREKRAAEQDGRFVPFDFGEKWSVRRWIDRGGITVEDDARFRTQADVLALFGRDIERWQRGTYGLDPAHMVWYPRLYEIPGWDNSLGANGRTIVERWKGGTPPPSEPKRGERRFVFARYQDEYAERYYVFVGVFVYEETAGEARIYRRVADRLTGLDGRGGFAVPEGL